MLYQIDHADLELLIHALHTYELALTQALINDVEAVAERNKHPLRPVGDYVKSRLLDGETRVLINNELDHTRLMLKVLGEIN